MTTLSVTVQDDDPEALDRLVRLLRDDIRNLDVDIDFAPGLPAPADAKGTDPQLSHLIVVTDSTSPVLIELGRVLRDFVDRGPRRIVVVEGDRKLEIEAPLDDAAKQEIDSFFRDGLG